MARCDNCMANKVCDHNRFGFENCGNYIPAADVAPRAEVAREIFEEIDKILESSTPYYLIHIGLAELKKKYTEQQCTDCKHFVGCECFSGMTCDQYEEKSHE